MHKHGKLVEDSVCSVYGVRVHVRGVGFSVVPEIVVDLDRGEVSLLTMKGRDASLAREIICSLISCGVGWCVCMCVCV